MSPCEFQPLLGAYHDGELAERACSQLEAHLAECRHCRAELEGIKDLAIRMVGSAREQCVDATAVIPGMHRAIDRAIAQDVRQRSLARTARRLTAMAASVLVVSAAWAIDARRTVRLATPSPAEPAPLAIAPAWERVAMTLRADPRPGATDGSPPLDHYAAAVDWMLDGLLPAAGPHPSAAGNSLDD